MLDQFKLIFYGWWSDWEEDGWIIICEKSGQYYYQEGGHCVMAVDDKEKLFQPDLISEEEALQLMLEWEEHEDPDTATVSEALMGLDYD